MCSFSQLNPTYTSEYLKLYACVSNKWWMFSFVQICNVVVVPSSVNMFVLFDYAKLSISNNVLKW